MKKTGEKLKKKREELGYSIGEIALATKIAAKTLEAIEQADKTSLPSLPYLRGFIRTYARHLKLDPNEMIKSFNDELNPENPKPLTEQFVISKPRSTAESLTTAGTETTPDKRETQKSPPSKTMKGYKVFLGVIVVVVLILLTIGIKKIINKYQKEATLSKEPPQITHTESSPKQSAKNRKLSIVTKAKNKDNSQKAKHRMRANQKRRHVTKSQPQKKEDNFKENKLQPSQT